MLSVFRYTQFDQNLLITFSNKTLIAEFSVKSTVNNIELYVTVIILSYHALYSQIKKTFTCVQKVKCVSITVSFENIPSVVDEENSIYQK